MGMDDTSSRKETLLYIAQQLDGQDNPLPTVPEVLVRVQKAVNDQNMGARDLAGVILEDPALTASVLRLSNSAFYSNMRTPVRTITSGLVLLGFESVRNLALGLSVYHLFGNLPHTHNYRQIWQHSLCVAVSARRLAKRVKLPVPEEGFLCGLIHDIGKLILAHFFPERYQQTTQLMETKKISLLDAEQEIFHCNHMQAGQFLAEYWHFPQEIAEVVGAHDASKTLEVLAHSNNPLAKAVAIGNRIAHYFYGSDDKANPTQLRDIENLFADGLDIKRQDTKKYLKEIKQEVAEIASVLDLVGDDWEEEKTSTTASAPTPPGSNERDRLDFLLQATELAGSVDDFSIFLQETAASLFHALKLDALLLLFKNQQKNALVPKFGYGVAIESLRASINIELNQDDDVAAYAYLHDAHVIVTPDNQHLFSRISEVNMISILGSLNVVAIPVHLKSQVAATFVVSRPYNAPAFSDEDLRLLHIYVRQIDGIFTRMYQRGGTDIIRRRSTKRIIRGGTA